MEAMITLQKAVHHFRKVYSEREEISIEDTPPVSALSSFRSDDLDGGWIISGKGRVPLAAVGDDGSVEMLL